MVGKDPEFIISYIVTGESGRLTVIGRCGDVPLRVNDTFGAILQYKRRKYPEEMGDDPILEKMTEASIHIDRIEAYDRVLDRLGEGMTGSMVVSGEGIESLSPGMVLGMRNGHHPGSRNGQGE